jgi:polar amino acid transport system permease protein
LALAANWLDLLRGLGVTLEVSALSLALCIAIGLVLAIARLLPSRLTRTLALCYIEFFRNIPPLVHLFFFFFALPRLGIVLPAFTCGILGLAMYHASYVAEILRAGIVAVGRDQMDAARGLGLSYLGAMRYVILPQSVWLVAPPLGNLFISLFKTSAIVATIGIVDLMYQGQILNERTFETFPVFGAVGLVYLACSMVFGTVLERLDAQARRRRAGHAA